MTALLSSATTAVDASTPQRQHVAHPHHLIPPIVTQFHDLHDSSLTQADDPALGVRLPPHPKSPSFRREGTTSGAMCIHALYIFVPCAHHAWSHHPRIPCAHHARHQRFLAHPRLPPVPPCAHRDAHPFTTRLIHRLCAACARVAGHDGAGRDNDDGVQVEKATKQGPQRVDLELSRAPLPFVVRVRAPSLRWRNVCVYPPEKRDGRARAATWTPSSSAASPVPSLVGRRGSVSPQSCRTAASISTEPERAPQRDGFAGLFAAAGVAKEPERDSALKELVLVAGRDARVEQRSRGRGIERWRAFEA